MLAVKSLVIPLTLLLVLGEHPVEGNVIGNKVKQEESDYRLPTYAVPRHYNIKLIPHIIPGNFTFDGEVVIELHVERKTKELVVHSKNLTISETVLTTAHGSIYSVPSGQNYNNETEMLTINFDEEIVPDNYSLYFKYSGLLNSNSIGFYRTSYTDDRNETVWLAVTQFESTYARSAFPCLDEPALKSTFDVSIKHYPNYTAVSNMPVRERSEIDEVDGKLWTNFNTTPVMSTYLVSFLVSDYTNTSNSDGSMNLWCRSNAVILSEFTFEFAQKALQEMQRYANTSVRVPKLDVAAIPELDSEAMENWGLMTFKEAGFLYNETYNLPTDKSLFAMQITHEVAHQWFGNIVTPSWWTHLWLKEGLASLFQFYITDKIYPDWRLMDIFVTRIVQFSLSTISAQYPAVDNVVYAPREIEEKYNAVAYCKAPTLFRMLLHCLSEEVFHKGLVSYLQEYEYSTASPEDLWTALQDIANESDLLYNKFDIQKIMTPWVQQAGHPLVNVHRNYETGEVTVSQEYYDNDYMKASNESKNVPRNATWWIPINFATKSIPDFSTTSPALWLSPEAENMTIGQIDARDWIIVNVQQTGCYRVNYDDANWRKIAVYLNSEDYTNIHVLNRMQILNDAAHMLITSRIDPTTFLEITKYLRHETDYVVWYNVFEPLNNILKYIVQETEAKYLKMYIWSLMDNLIESLGFDDHADDDYLTKVVRYHMRMTACNVSHPKCLRAMHEKLIVYLKRRELHKIPDYLQYWIICSGLKIGNESTWYTVLDIYKNDSELLSEYLCCIDNRTIIENYLNMCIKGDSILPTMNITQVVVDLSYTQPEYVDFVFDFLKRNWDKIRKEDDNVLNHIFYQFSRSDQIRKLREFLNPIDEKMRTDMEQTENFILSIEPSMKQIRNWLKKQNYTLATLR